MSSAVAPKSRFEVQFKTKEEAVQASAEFWSSVPLLQAAEYKDDVVCVTGGNKGIGYEVARQLGAKGLKVVLGCRDETRGKEALQKLQEENKSAAFHFVQLDVMSAESVAAAVASVSAVHGRLDVLVNNAGIVGDHTLPSQVDGAALRAAYETNVFGPMLLTKAFLPLLEKSQHPRIVNVTTGLGSFDVHTNKDNPYFSINVNSYCSSKAALNMYTLLLANEYAAKNSNLRVNTVCPGWTATDFNDHKGPQTLQEAAISIVNSSLLAPKGPSGAFLNRFGYVAW